MASALLRRTLRSSTAHLAHFSLSRQLLSSTPRRLCNSAAESAAQQQQLVARWSARLAHDNTFLSYHRNAIIATVAGCALIQYRKGEGRPPLAGTGLLVMGGLYIYVGSGLYVWQCRKLRGPLRLGKSVIFWSIFNAAWPLAIWSVSLACLLDETPAWLITALRHSESYLPATLRSSLFLDPPALYPVCRLLHAVVRHEERRLCTVRGHAENDFAADAAAGRGLARTRSEHKRRESLSGGWGRGGGSSDWRQGLAINMGANPGLHRRSPTDQRQLPA